MQLDDFVDKKITDDGTPELLFIENEEDLNFIDDYDEEERIAQAESFSEVSTDSSIVQDTDEKITSKVESIMRIKIIKDEEESFIDSTGKEFILNLGDIHQIDEALGTMLIDLGYAELANL